MPAFIRFLLICGALWSACPSAVRSQPAVLWSARRPLVWEDFKGPRPPHSRRWDAVTFSRLNYQARRDSTGRVQVRVGSYFETGKSWKKRSRLDTFLLHHEQAHFNITELHARKVRRAYQDLAAAHPDDDPDRSALRAILYRQNRACQRYQRRFDRKTRHSRRRADEGAWETRIRAELRALESYSSDSVACAGYQSRHRVRRVWGQIR